jgi:DGQHR domain-containing protein
MGDDNWITFSCIRIHQPLGQFYIGVINSADLVRISFADRRRIEGGEREVEVVSGIERPLSPKKVAELRQYVNNVDASFPTGIILSVKGDDAKFDEAAGTMSVRDNADVAKIIDGQHRIEGLQAYDGQDQFELNVTIFVDMDMEDQAILFSTINLKQTPVTKSLVYDLFDYARTRSPQKTCHQIARLLNSREGSPFHRKIMILGTATGSPSETLTQAGFIDPLMKYVSEDPMRDRDQLRRGRKLEPVDDATLRVRKLIFRNMFVEDHDAEIARVLWNYFTAVAQKWPDAWTGKQEGLILNRTTGYRALMRFLPNAYLHIGYEVAPAADFKAIFDRVKLRDADFTPEMFKPGTSGQAALYRKLVLDTKLDEDSFWKRPKPGPPGHYN